MRRCNTCQGTYSEIQADGTEYYHACPPLSVPEMKAALALGPLPLTPAQQAQLTAAQAADVRTPPLPGTLSQTDLVLETFSLARANARDENVIVVGKDALGNPVVQPKATGPGFTQL